MILFVDKPIGITSFDVIRKLRKKLGIKKMGHSGTLDPLASGLLIIATDEDTKKLLKLIGLPKTYEVEILLGKRTTTGDLEGEVIEEGDPISLTEEEKKKAVMSLKGINELPVPTYSAIKQGGVPLYKKARKGEKVDTPLKNMEVINAEVKEITEDKVICELEVSSGTYIRSLAEEVGRRLGVPATVSKLRRIKIGDFRVEDAEVL